MAEQSSSASNVSTLSYSIDPNYAAENAVAGALGLVPDVGSILSALVYIFWPASEEDVWSAIEAKVAALIQQNLSQLVHDQVAADLQGLNNNLSSYLTALNTGKDHPTYISEKWNVANGMFLQFLPTFQLNGYQLLLSPYFAQFANMHLSLLRDGVAFGSQWGWTPPIVAQTLADLKAAIAAYSSYAQSTFETGRAAVVASAPNDNHAAQPFRTVNAFIRQMNLSLLDYKNLWPYFDVSLYPNGATVVLEREIYSDPQGTCDNSGPINLPTPPTQPIQQITVWGWDRIDAVQVAYPAGGGPGGSTVTPRMGDSSGGSNSAPHGGVFQVANNPVTSVGGGSGDIVNAMSLSFTDGSGSGQLGGNYPGGGGFAWSFPGHILSSIYINGVSSFYGSADCVVFGFKLKAPQHSPGQLDELSFITSPGAPLTAAPTTAAASARQAWWAALANRS